MASDRPDVCEHGGLRRKCDLCDCQAELDAAREEAGRLREALETEKAAWETAAEYLAEHRRNGCETSLGAIFEMIDGGNPRLEVLLGNPKGGGSE